MDVCHYQCPNSASEGDRKLDVFDRKLKRIYFKIDPYFEKNDKNFRKLENFRVIYNPRGKVPERDFITLRFNRKKLYQVKGGGGGDGTLLGLRPIHDSHR